MDKRINKLLQKTLRGELFFSTTPVEYDREDLFLSPVRMSSKRLAEYMAAQRPLVFEENRLGGMIRFDGSVEGDIFGRAGHKNFDYLKQYFYNKPVNNLLTFEWQHAAGDFEKVLKGGIVSVKREIAESRGARGRR